MLTQTVDRDGAVGTHAHSLGHSFCSAEDYFGQGVAFHRCIVDPVGSVWGPGSANGSAAPLVPTAGSFLADCDAFTVVSAPTCN